MLSALNIHLQGYNYFLIKYFETTNTILQQYPYTAPLSLRRVQMIDWSSFHKPALKFLATQFFTAKLELNMKNTIKEYK